jgi:hypothetical protein
MAYTSGSASDRLASVRAAIEGILTGSQQYQTGGVGVTKGSLATLLEMEKQLMMQVNAENNGSGWSVCRIENPK